MSRCRITIHVNAHIWELTAVIRLIQWEVKQTKVLYTQKNGLKGGNLLIHKMFIFKNVFFPSSLLARWVEHIFKKEHFVD